MSVPQDEVDSDDLTVYHNSDGEWAELDTTVSVDGNEYVVTVETDGFSQFAVVEDSDAEADEQESADGETDAESDTGEQDADEQDADEQESVEDGETGDTPADGSADWKTRTRRPPASRLF